MKDRGWLLQLGERGGGGSGRRVECERCVRCLLASNMALPARCETLVRGANVPKR